LSDTGNSKLNKLAPWKPGQSGNPNGRPKIHPDLKVLAKDLCPEVIHTWAEIMRNGQRDSDRIRAAENLWAIAYGRPGPAEPEAAKERPIVIPAEFVE